MESAPAEESALVAQLENELQATRTDLQSTVEEMESSNEELKSTNEELQSTNEELQSANEELQSTNEELESSKEELQSFIRSITAWKEVYGGKETKKQGERCMIDLYQLVLNYYMPPLARGSNSIKQILPAIVHDSEFLRTKYSQPVYGRKKDVMSLNFEEHVWIDPKLDNDPYKTLPRLFERHSAEELDKLVFGVDSIDDGGTAMMAYNRLQFSEIPDAQREEIKNGLLRYCELDTMAMVMIIEGWKHFQR